MTDDQHADVPWTLGQTRTELWFAWVDIAIEAEGRAVTARRAGRRSLRDNNALSKALERETVAAMVAVVAAGATLETIGKNLAQFRPQPRATGAANKFIAMATAAFPQAQLDGPLQARIHEVFRHRNDTVHYASAWQDMTEHATGVRTTKAAATYSVESAERAVSTVVDVLRSLTSPGVSYSQPAEWWAFYWRTLPDELEDKRTKLRSGPDPKRSARRGSGSLTGPIARR